MPSPTRYVVGGLMGLGMLVALFFMLRSSWGVAGFVVAGVLLAYEGWTLINQYPRDTISEIIWTYAERPMVPYVFGIASGWALASGVFPNQYVVASLFFLMGHFFFQRHGE
jgi:hypothetical protein